MGIARLYRTPMPYNAADLSEVDFEQSADIMYFAHLSYPPTKLTRAGHTNWTFSTVTFGPTILAPTGMSVAAYGSTGDPGYTPTNYDYVVTAIRDDLAQESRASTVVSATNDLTLDGHYNIISGFTAVGANRYVVYKGDNGVYGYIGGTEGSTFEDRNIAADLSDTPPKATNPFAGAGDYPSTVTFFEQRLMWARTSNKPNGIWGSQSSDFENMDVSRPAKADDALAFGLVAGRVNAVNQLASMKNLLALTSDSVFVIDGGGTDTPLTPSSIVSRRQTGRGASRLGPLIIDNIVFFRPSQGSSVRTLGYTFQLDGYESNNVTIFSPHFFENMSIIAWAYQQEPYACVWAVRNDGKLLCFTWEQEQQVWGWSLCETDGAVEDVCTITEYGMDRVYLAVRRTINDVEDVFIERMALPLTLADNLAYANHLDCAVSFEFEEPTATIGQLWHLDGAIVTAFHDGNVTTGLLVENGTIILPDVASVVTVGLPYVGYIETLPLPLQGQSSEHTSRQTLARVAVRTHLTRGLTVGPGGGDEFEIKQRNDEPPGSPVALKTGDFFVNLSAKWTNGSTIVVRQNYPLPATISALFVDPIVTS